ncbi:MAG TPA: 2-hydroxyacyl-CoA dehydratase [Firmicutes bacterium]|jgi:benzoyl-CoA reductase/2-hydroxyglutaryl-CoA dehydratase subunit BcrC/BadD/HgdB|nr:2-hydroxyacyl-CoA dehydratase [Bacillota bacterium]
MSEKKNFKTAALMKEMMRNYYAQGATAKEKGIPVAWVTAVFPVEILYAAGIFPYYPENFGALASARKVADKLSLYAEAKGYAHDLCGYARCGIGDVYATEHPVGEILAPDVIFCCNTQCGTLPKWFEAASRHYNVPYFLLDSPQIPDQPEELITDYYVDQLKEMISFLEEITGEPFDYGRLAEVLRLSNETCRLWNEVLDTSAMKPAPFGFFDACFHMAPIVTMRGTPEAVNYYRALKEEVDERINKGIPAIPNERYKIYFDHIPLWPKLRWLSDLFASHNCLVAVSQYTHSWAYSFDLERPLESLAENYTEEFVNRSFEYRLQLKMNFFKKYGVDGFVLFSNRSCKPTSLGLYDKRSVLNERTGLPGVVFDADMSDLRFFSEAQILARLEPFFEQLASSR